MCFKATAIFVSGRFLTQPPEGEPSRLAASGIAQPAWNYAGALCKHPAASQGRLALRSPQWLQRTKVELDGLGSKD